MQQRLRDLEEINAIGQSRWQQFEQLDVCKKKWEIQRRKTRKHCGGCQCVLYVRSATDQVPDEKDLDVVYSSPNSHCIFCFQCAMVRNLVSDTQ